MFFKNEEDIEKINKLIDDLVNEEKYIFNQTSQTVENLIETFRSACEGGKRLRALLVLFGYRLAAGDEIPDDIYKAAASYEIFQTGILIHDDIIDNSKLRRDKPTVHVALGGDKLAESNAICLGDFGIFLSERVLSKLEVEPERLVKAMRIYNKTLMNTIAGELLDVNAPYSKHVNRERIENIAYYKTAWYTIIGPMLFGAILGGAKNKLLENIEEFGRHAGIAFQYRDDILGIFGSEATIGKSVTSDIEEKKLTLLYLFTLEEANSEQVEIMNAYYGKENVSEKEARIIREMMGDLEVDMKVEKIIKEEVKLARDCIKSLTKRAELEDELQNFVDYLVLREK